MRVGIRDLRRDTEGDPIDAENGIVISTIRMGYGHYRIAMAGASAAPAMGRTPYSMDLLAIPGITQDAINWSNADYSEYFTCFAAQYRPVRQVRVGVGHLRGQERCRA